MGTTSIAVPIMTGHRMSLDVSADPSTASLGDARAGTRNFLDRLAQPPVSTRAADDAVLAVSELVTNALRHGGGTCTLTLTAHADGIEVAVQDPSPHAPRTRTPDLYGGSGGFGWSMVNQLAQATAVTHLTTGGKTVSALLPR
ncbi:ATP-binding protein [Streptomyces sp. NPDC058662]|uniref:ATP-binding protein n=1 Tax=Streptomyces sp. NPDC058662 TaxID=3346583 RepID=UPI0036624B07